MNKIIIVSVLCFLLGGMLLAQDWVPFTKSDPEAPIINLTQSDNQQVEFTVEVCGMYQTDTVVNSTSFQRIIIPGGGRFIVTGEPEMPYIRQLIAIPECDSVVLSVNVTSSSTMQNYYVYPAPDYVEVTNPDSTVYLEEVFYFDTVAYNTNLYYPLVNAEINSTGYFRDQKYAEVFIYPVQFNPVSEEIHVNEEYEITLSFVNPSTPVNANVGIFNNIATNTMLNYPTTGVSAVINDNVDPDGTVQWKILTDTIEACTIVADYLIICADPFFQPDNPDSEVLRIANHRATYNGFNVAIINADNIISIFYDPENFPYEIERAIRQCIRRIYEGAHAQHTYDGKLGYVLLIGDVDAGNSGMPSSYEYGETHPSDYYFSCITQENGDYDLSGDLCIGRFCVDNNEEPDFTELHNIVEKSIYFESEYSFEDWRNNVAHANGNSYNEEYFPLYYQFIEDLLFEESLTIVNYYPLGGVIFQPVIDMLNLGAPVMMYDGHGYTDSWQDNLSIEELENNLSNTGKFPYVTSRACQTGWFDDVDDDCLAEALTTYSEDKGFVGFLGAARNHFDGGMHVIEDPPLFIQERIPYSIWQDQSFITGEFILETMIGIGAPGTAHLYNFFGDPALNIMAQGFEVTHDVTIPETASITEEVYLRSGNTIIMPSHSTLFFENDGKLIVEEDATLYIMNDATLSAISGTDDSLIVYGNLIVENNVHFSAAEDASFVIDIRNSELIESFTSATFENVILTGIASTLIFSACNFTDSYVELHKVENNQYFFLNQSYFDNTPLKACRSGMVVYPNVGKIVISDCDFINGSGLSVIEISGYPNFQITGTTVSYSDGDGISLYYSGNAVGTLHEVSNCEVHFTGTPVDDAHGIKAHYSRVDIENNYVHGNDIGLACLQRSSIRLTGNSQSNEEDQTQRIKDNISVQVYSDGSSFPYEFEYNSIYNDNENDFVVKMDNCILSGYDIKNNYWGENFSPEDDLYPANAYFYEPVWEPSWGG
ncbi:MAG: right-handed parallel beta-helix repeat-containing protein, partial [Bacteroidales bacterium]|nr:right-handed parallel beta-helix repeat-containing protein [Bacteroidales bacterium]